MTTITAQEFAQALRDAILSIQPAAPAPQAINVEAPIVNVPQVRIPAPVVNVEQPEINVEVDVDSIVQQLRALRGGMVRPSNLRGIVQQVKELGTITNKNTARVVRAIEDMASTAPTQTDIQRVVDELLEITAGVEMLSEDIAGLQEAAEQTTEAVNSVANIMNPYRDLTREQILDEFKRLGYGNWAALGANTQQELSRKLNMIKAIEDQAEAMIAYKQLNPRYIESGFERRAFDIFVKNTALSSNGKPLGQTFAYVPQQIPRATISFNQKTGVYDLSQDGVIDHVKNYRDAEKWALMGGDYAEEMRELRKIRQLTERREIKRPAVFQARKI